MGEFDLLRRLRDALPPPPPGIHVGVGDDAAVTAGGAVTVVSVDLLVEDVHFRRATSTPAQIGHKALAAALSDLAAMGVGAGEAYVALTVPADMSEDECMELLGGIRELAEETGATLAGGDISAGATVSIGVTVVGHLSDPDSAVRRDGARTGDVLVVTGELGGAAAGLLLIEDRAPGAELDDGLRDALIGRQLLPRPQLEAGARLAAAGARAMIDISDGLAADAGHLAAESGVHLSLDADAIPVAEGVAAVAAAAGSNVGDLSLGGGEDYELLAAMPPERVDEAREALKGVGVPLAVLGEAQSGIGVSLSSVDGHRQMPSGFDQLSRNPRPSA
jgi:thiamine-monophosphate kinase